MRRLRGMNNGDLGVERPSPVAVAPRPVAHRSRLVVATPEIDQRQHSRESAVDEGAVYDAVYVVEAVAQDGDARSDGDRGMTSKPDKAVTSDSTPPAELREGSPTALVCSHCFVQRARLPPFFRSPGFSNGHSIRPEGESRPIRGSPRSLSSAAADC